MGDCQRRKSALTIFGFEMYAKKYLLTPPNMLCRVLKAVGLLAFHQGCPWAHAFAILLRDVLDV